MGEKETKSEFNLKFGKALKEISNANSWWIRLNEFEKVKIWRKRNEKI